MPGINEINNSTEKVQCDVPAETAPPVQVDETNESASSPLNLDDLPPRETTQTDKVNNLLLKSFLEHINTNTHPINMQIENVQQNSDELESDWN